MTEKQILRHGLNGNQLKLIAVVSMLCDHAAIRLLAYGLIPALYAAGADTAAERWNQVFWSLGEKETDEPQFDPGVITEKDQTYLYLPEVKEYC